MVDGRGKVTRYRYGSFGVMREAINADNQAISYQYDLVMNTVLQVDRNGNHIRYTYDARNLLTSKRVEETGDFIQYTYDELGNRKTMSDDSGKSEYTYDRNNNLEEIKKDGNIELSYIYDAIGNIETVTDKKGSKTFYTYDKSSRMSTVAFNGKTTTYAYDVNGNRTSVTYEGGVKEAYTFDQNNRLTALTNKKPDGSSISSYSYTYDDAGRQISKTDNFGTTNYTYDAAGRILKVEAPGKTSVYGYDGSGNRQSFNETYTSQQPSGYINPMNGQDVTYAIKKSEYIYSSSNQLLKLIERMYNTSGEELLEKTTAYLYDNNGNELRQRVNYIHPHSSDMRQVTGGNLLGKSVNADINNLIEKSSNTYDGFNRLTKVEKVKGGKRSTVEFIYDGDGLRTTKTVQSSEAGYETKVTNYLYDRQYVILETDDQDAVITRYIKGVNYIARIDGSNKLSYYLFNGHGDVVQTVSEAGRVENQYDYDIFGNPILTVEAEYKNAIRYAGEFYDEETGLYYLRARYYDPYIGRFISEDSYWGEDTNPLSLNLYTYAFNDPIQYIDPSGHFPLGLFKGVVGAVANIMKKVIPKPKPSDNKQAKEPTPQPISNNDSSGSSNSGSSGSSGGSSSNSNYTGNSIVDYLNSRGMDTSFSNRGDLAEQYGIDGYRGTVDQNLTLLEKLRSNETTSSPAEPVTAETVIEKEQSKAEKTVNKAYSYAPPLDNNLSINTSYYSNYDTYLLQKKLMSMGYVGMNGQPLYPTGRFDANTQNAVNQFKEQNGLWNHDQYYGVVGETTWEKAFSTDAKIYSYTENMNRGETPEKGTIDLTNNDIDTKQNGTINLPQEGFVAPIKVGRITSLYGPRWGTTHSGVDVGAEEGTSVYAVTEGTLTIRINGPGKDKNGNVIPGPENGYGYYVYLEFDEAGGGKAIYGHLTNEMPENILEKLNQNANAENSSGDFHTFNNTQIQVQKGEHIGYTGNSGSSTGPHLHFTLHMYEAEDRRLPGKKKNFSLDNSVDPLTKIDFGLEPTDQIKEEYEDKYGS
jgi:RHS repeat-associated protein